MTRTQPDALSPKGSGHPADEHVLVELVTDALIVVDLDGRLRYANPACKRILGRDPVDHVGLDILELAHPDDRALAMQALESARSASGVRADPLRIRVAHVDGSWRWLEVVANNLLDDDRVNGIVLSARDVTERVEADEALRASEERFRRIVELAADGIWATDLDGNTTFVNPRMATLLQYSVEEMIGRPAQDFCDAEHGARAQGFLERGQPSTAAQHEFCFLRKDGSELWVLVNATRLYDGKGNHVGMLTMVTDLTQRRADEMRLRAAEAEYRALVAHSSDIITVLDADGTFRSTSLASERVLGYPEDFDTGDIFSYVHPDEVELAIQGFEELLAGNTPEPRVLRVRAYDGTWRHLEIVSRNLLDDPAVHGVVLNARDVTDRVEAQAAALKSMDRFESLVKHTSDMTTVAGTDARIQYVSPSVTPMLGYQPEELVGEDARFLLHPDDLERVEQTLIEQITDGAAAGLVQYRLRHRDGSWRSVEGVTTNLLDEPSVAGVVTNTRDITDRLAAEARARQLEAVLAKSNEFVVLFDEDGRVTWANEKARTWLRLEGNEHVSDVATIESRERLRNDIVPFVRAHGLWTGELMLRTTDDEEIPVVCTLQAHRRDSEIVLISAIAHDITELKQIQHRLRYEATHDPLTGLPNRSLFRELGEQALARAERHGTQTAVLFLDLDGFKDVNDTLGHSVGDTALVEIGARLRIGVRSGDVIARLGGDEFCVLCERVSGDDEARELARRLVDVIGVPVAIAGRRLQLGTSVGVAVNDGGSTTIEKLIRFADVALYDAKQAGRGQVACFAGVTSADD